MSPQDFEVVGTVNGGWPETAQIAVATAKGNGLAEAITAALNHAIDDGSYAEVLERWGLTSEAIETSETNPPGLPQGLSQDPARPPRAARRPGTTPIKEERCPARAPPSAARPCRPPRLCRCAALSSCPPSCS